ncbi:Protein LIFEGUARD 4 [Asimina triloba]
MMMERKSVRAAAVTRLRDGMRAYVPCVPGRITRIQATERRLFAGGTQKRRIEVLAGYFIFINRMFPPKILHSARSLLSNSQCMISSVPIRRSQSRLDRSIDRSTTRKERMWDSDAKSKGFDIEAGLYPGMEGPQLRWDFVRKVYCILSIQLLMTVAVAAAVVYIHPIAHFFAHTKEGLIVYIGLSVLNLILLLLLAYFHRKHPVNFVLLILFTVSISFQIGLACSFAGGKVVMQAAILTTVIVVSLTLYTFWAAKRGSDFSKLGPFLFAALLMLMILSLIQVFIPFGKVTNMIIAAVSALIFCGFILFDTDNLIKRYSYDEYIPAALCLYLDIINLFLSLLTLLMGLDE